MSGPEFQKVEAPLIAQLVRMGWKHTTGNLDQPSVSGRGSFREVLLLGSFARRSGGSTCAMASRGSMTTASRRQSAS